MLPAAKKKTKRNTSFQTWYRIEATFRVLKNENFPIPFITGDSFFRSHWLRRLHRHDAAPRLSHGVNKFFKIFVMEVTPLKYLYTYKSINSIMFFLYSWSLTINHCSLGVIFFNSKPAWHMRNVALHTYNVARGYHYSGCGFSMQF